MKPITLETAIQKAHQKAKELGYDPSHMVLKADENNTAWNEYVRSGPVFEWNPELKRQLGDSDFWAISYVPSRLQLGGDLTIFVDKKTGEIITTIQGE